MKISSYSLTQLKQKLKSDGVCLRTGNYLCRITTSLPLVAEGIATLYADYPVQPESDFADFHICLKHPNNIRRWIKPQVIFTLDRVTPFKPLAYDQAFPMLEWGLNWCISTRINNQLIIHAAVVEKNGYALIMPGEPGSGKSTLCAALVSRGWRLLSDELTMVSLQDGKVNPLPRPVSLKNESIDVIRSFHSDAIMGRISHDTAKGTVAHMRIPTEHVERSNETAIPAWVVFPKYIAGSPLSLIPLTKGNATIRLVENSFNYSILSEKGFVAITDLVDKADCFDFSYSVLDEAIAQFDTLVVLKAEERANG